MAVSICPSYDMYAVMMLMLLLPVVPLLQVSSVSKWKHGDVSPDALTAINTEWGCYGSKLLPRCQEDVELDAASGAQKGMRMV